MIADLRNLWIEAFADTQETIDAFFAVAFSDTRTECILENGMPVSALYWFDCQCYGRKLAYIYAVATAKEHRGKGLAHRLLGNTHTRLTQQGYAGAILVPSSQSLFDFYEKIGYRTATTITEFSASWGDTPVTLTEIDADRYATLRKTYLPLGGVVQEKEMLSYLQTYARFYAGADFLLLASVEDNTLHAQELLGNTQAAPSILRALRLPQGNFRTLGAQHPFAMFLPLQADCPTPTYFGLALD